jgi:hypothetical protein
MATATSAKAPRPLSEPLMGSMVLAVEPVEPVKCLCLQQAWVLTLYCLASGMQALAWMTYASVDPSVAVNYLGVGTNATSNATREEVLTWIVNAGPIGYIITVFTVPLLLLHPQGLRYALLLAGAMPLLATVLRMVPAWVVPGDGNAVNGSGGGDDASRSPYLWLVFVAQAINAMAAPYTQALPSHVSQTWFGVSWRALATSIGRSSNAAGRCVGYFIGPAVGGNRLDNLLWLELGLAAVILVAVLAYFPAAPRVAPTRR